MNKPWVFIVVGFLLTALVGGCMATTAGPTIGWNLKGEIDALDLTPVISFSIGKLGLFTMRKVANAVEENDEAINLLKGLKKVNVAIYEVKEENLTATLTQLETVTKDMKKHGWDLFLRVRDGRELVNGLYKTEKNAITSLALLVSDTSELIVLEVEGNLSEVIQQACSMGSNKNLTDMMHTHHSQSDRESDSIPT